MLAAGVPPPAIARIMRGAGASEDTIAAFVANGGQTYLKRIKPPSPVPLGTFLKMIKVGSPLHTIEQRMRTQGSSEADIETMMDAHAAHTGKRTTVEHSQGQTAKEVQAQAVKSLRIMRPAPDQEGDAVDWGSVEDGVHVSTSGEGSNGVVFVKTVANGCQNGGKTFVVKSSSQIAQELFASAAMRALSIPTPATRVVSHTQSEYSAIKACIQGFADSVHYAAVTAGETAAERQARENATQVLLAANGPLDRAQLLVMDFVEGGKGVGGNRDVGSIVGGNARALGNLGSILAADVLLNNSDRVPLPCWNMPEGNAGNIMLVPATAVLDPPAAGSAAEAAPAAEQGNGDGNDSIFGASPPAVDKAPPATAIKASVTPLAAEPEPLVAIDSAVCSIRTTLKGRMGQEDPPNPFFNRYEENARNLLTAVCEESGSEGKPHCLCAVREFFLMEAGFAPTDADLELVRAGFLQTVADIGLNDSFLPLLRELHGDLASLVPVDWKDVWADGGKQIHVDYLERMVGMFSEVASAHADKLEAPRAVVLPRMQRAFQYK